MSGVATAIGAGTVAGALIQSGAASDAAQTQANAANYASQLSDAQYNQTRSDYAPWRQAGSQAITQMSNDLPQLSQNFTMANFQADPGYQFRMDQGNQAIERSAAARGGLNSGATLKALTRYGQGTAAQEYQSAYDRFNADRDQKFNKLASIAGVGQTATAGTAQAGTANAQQIGANTMSAANASSAADMAGANAITGAMGQGMNTWMQYNTLNKMFPAKGV